MRGRTGSTGTIGSARFTGSHPTIVPAPMRGSHASTPKTVWGHYGFSDETVARGDFNAQMFTSFLDGTKSGIEMAAVANAIHDATGVRLRRVPFRDARVLAALNAARV